MLRCEVVLLLLVVSGVGVVPVGRVGGRGEGVGRVGHGGWGVRVVRVGSVGRGGGSGRVVRRCETRGERRVAREGWSGVSGRAIGRRRERILVLLVLLLVVAVVPERGVSLNGEGRGRLA